MTLHCPSRSPLIPSYSDEADVFLEARDKSEMERNALVSGESTHIASHWTRTNGAYQSYFV